MNEVTIGAVVRLGDFGLERLDEDKAIVGFAEKAEGKVARWLDFAKGALLFVTVPNDPESGAFYIFDRTKAVFYWLALPIEGRFGRFREDEFDRLTQVFDLVMLARNPRPPGELMAREFL